MGQEDHFSPACLVYITFLNFYLFIFREEGREEERERNISALSWLGPIPATQACTLTRNQTGNLPLCETMPNPTELHQCISLHNFEIYKILQSKKLWRILGLSLDFVTGNKVELCALAGVAQWIEHRLQTEGFDSQLGYMPGLRDRSSVGATWEATPHWYFSVSPSLPLSKNK